MSKAPPVNVGIFYTSGDLGEVGRDVMVAALQYPPTVIQTVRVFTIHTASSQLSTERGNEKKSRGGLQQQQLEDTRLQFIHVDLYHGPDALQLQGLDTVICCLGNRKPFYDNFVAEQGTRRIVTAMAAANVTRIVMLSSVGVGDDWPPLEWHMEGSRLQGFFRTICWRHFQDLCGAELAVRQAATDLSDSNSTSSSSGGGDEQMAGDDQKAGDEQRQTENSKSTLAATSESRDRMLQFLIVRAVFLSDSTASGKWHVQEKKYADHPAIYMSKMDCAAYLVSEALQTLTNKTVVVGGVPVI